MTALFSFEDVVLDADGRRILDGITATIADQGITCLMGPSGSGKSTLLRLCNRLEVPTSGRVLFRDRDVAELDPLVHRRTVGMVFQRPTPFPGTVRDNLRVAAPDATEQEMRDALQHAALEPEMLDRVADDLSGGEQQRMCLARSLMARPEVLLMDEPTSALDPRATEVLEGLAETLAHERGVPIVWVSHDPEQVARLADACLVLDQGRVVEVRG